MLWGRQRDPKLSLKETSLTQFGPDVLTGMYVPLFMFNGKYSVSGPSAEGLYQIRLHTAFRNRLALASFPTRSGTTPRSGRCTRRPIRSSCIGMRRPSA